MNNDKPKLLIRQPEQLSIHWAQHIISLHDRHAKVSAVRLHQVDAGTSTRMRIEVDHDAGDQVPTRWFIKTPPQVLRPRLANSVLGLLHKEVRFYHRLAPQIPLRLPRLLAADSRIGRGSTLVLSDLAEAAIKPGRIGEALTAEQAERVLEQLARLHGHFLHYAKLLHRHHWLGGLPIHVERHAGNLLAERLMKRGLQQAGGLVDQALHKPALLYSANRNRCHRLLGTGPKTLVHYDCHPGNLFWQGGEPGFLDWQLVRKGEGIGDVAYFLATALPVEIRRQHERRLIGHYAGHLARHSRREVDEEALFKRYRVHLSYPFEAMLVTLAIGDLVDADSNAEVIKRAAAAVGDHDSFGQLQALREP